MKNGPWQAALRTASRAVQIAAGDFILTGLPGYRGRLLADWTRGGTSLGGVENWLFAGLSRALDRRYYDPAASTAERERLKALCMARTSAVAWAQQYLALGFPDRQTPALSMFARIEAALASGEVRSVHQVACCSGREIAFFANRYPRVRFVGSDCDEALVAFLRETWKSVENLAFELVRLEAPPSPEDRRLECDLLYASGGFHYMDPASLRCFLGRARPRAARLFLSQPMDRGYRLREAVDSAPRRQLSWNHPYPACLMAAGWDNVTAEENYVDDLPGLKNVAVFAGHSPAGGASEREKEAALKAALEWNP